MKVELDVPAMKTIKKKYVEHTDFDPRKKYTILKPTPGCGKTYSTVQHLRHLVDRNVRIAWVTSRRALNRNMEGRLGVSLFTWNSYLDFDKDQKASAEFEKTDGVLISVQQLYHLQKKYDIVILDEIEVTLNTFSGAADTHTHKRISHAVDNFTALVRLLMQAKKVIIMDALVSKKAIRFIQNVEASYEHPHILRQLPLTWDKNEYQTRTSNIEIIGAESKGSPRSFMLYNERSEWWANVIKSLEDGKKLFVIIPAKLGKFGVEKLSRQLKKRFGWGSQELRHYHAGQHKEKDLLSKCEETWNDPRVRCIITNSCITVGVDFNLSGVFDEIHACYTPVVGLRDFRIADVS